MSGPADCPAAAPLRRTATRGIPVNTVVGSLFRAVARMQVRVWRRHPATSSSGDRGDCELAYPAFPGLDRQVAAYPLPCRALASGRSRSLQSTHGITGLDSHLRYMVRPRGCQPLRFSGRRSARIYATSLRNRVGSGPRWVPRAVFLVISATSKGHPHGQVSPTPVRPSCPSIRLGRQTVGSPSPGCAGGIRLSHHIRQAAALRPPRPRAGRAGRCSASPA